MDIKLNTVTPIWTGGVTRGEMHRIRETGLIGSLRWWYEAIVRGLGGEACDPTRHSCPRKNGARCAACEVFGTTSWRRRFRLEVVEEDDMRITSNLNLRPWHPNANRGWFLPAGNMGKFTIRLDGDEHTLALLASLLLFLERWGHLGAKPQLGYGLFQIDRTSREKLKAIAGMWAWKQLGKRPMKHDLPDLRQFAFFRYRFDPTGDWWKQAEGLRKEAGAVEELLKDHRIVPIAPDLKNQWRFFEWDDQWGKQNQFFGQVRRNNNIRSKVAVSWAYQTGNSWEIRGFAELRGLKSAVEAWEMFCNKEVWRKITGSTGTLEAYPSGVWHPRSIHDTIRFLG